MRKRFYAWSLFALVEAQTKNTAFPQCSLSARYFQTATKVTEENSVTKNHYSNLYRR